MSKDLDQIRDISKQTANDTLKEVAEAMESDIIFNYGQLHRVVGCLYFWFNNLLMEVVDTPQYIRACRKHYTLLEIFRSLLVNYKAVCMFRGTKLDEGYYMFCEIFYNPVRRPNDYTAYKASLKEVNAKNVRCLIHHHMHRRSTAEVLSCCPHKRANWLANGVL